jgi:hypothetical protein
MREMIMEDLPYDISLDGYDFDDEPEYDVDGYVIYTDNPKYRCDLDMCACDGSEGCFNEDCYEV